MANNEYAHLWWYILLAIPIILIYVRFSAKSKREWQALSGETKMQVAPGEQDREYMRLESAFPVEFQKAEADRGGRVNILQGLTKDLSKTGMQIETVAAKGSRLDDNMPNGTKLKLVINIPSETHATIAFATVRWVRKTEDITVDRYSLGVSYDDIAKPDLDKIIRYAMRFRRKADVFSLVIVIALLLTVAFVSAVFFFGNIRTDLERRATVAEEERQRLAGQTAEIKKEKEEIEENLENVTQKYRALQKALKEIERERDLQKRRLAAEEEKIKALKAASAPRKEDIVLSDRDIITESEEESSGEGAYETGDAYDAGDEPVVKVRQDTAPEDEILFEPNITRGMVDEEKKALKSFRDYILREDIAKLSKYCSSHKSSIYHAGGLFAVAELSYKAKKAKDDTTEAYEEVIALYPGSKYASYASHRLDQLETNLQYGIYTLKHFYNEYNLPPLFDYRELEPYKE